MIKLQAKIFELNFLSKFSDLKSNFTLTLGYLNPALNNWGQIYYSPETSHLTELSIFAEDLSFLEVLDSRTTHTGKYPGKTGERTGKGNGPGKAKQ